jgi:hypothetical protein
MKRVKRSRLAWLGVVPSCVVFLLASSATLGQINPGIEIQVAGTATFQASPAVASDAAGNVYVAVWQKQVAGGWEVFARRYTLSGGALVPGAEFQVNTVTAGCQVLPAVATDFNGNFVVVWQSDQDPGGGAGVYARRYTSAGAALDAAEFRVNTTAAGNQARPAVAVAPDGRFLVAWQSDQQTGGQGWDVVAQAYNASGTLAGSEVLVNSATAGSQTLPRAAYLSAPTEGFAVAWESVGAIFVRRVLMSGAALDASDRQVNTTAAGFHRSPAVASDPSGNYTIVWEGWDADGVTSRILGRRFQGVSTSGADVTIDATAGATQQRNPAVASDTLGNWLVSWDSVGEDASGAALVAQQLDNRQTLTGAKAVLNNTITAGDQTLPGLALAQGSRLLVAWQSLTPAADGAVIEARPGNLTGGGFYTLQPCRLLDTRNAAGPLGGPALTSGVKRVFPVVSSGCGIPATAKALSVNVTAVGAVATGSVNLFPGDGPSVGTVVVSFTATRSTIADNAHVLLSRDGTGSVAALASITGGGQVHLIIDVNGYYQ